MLSCCSSLSRRRLNLAADATVVDTRANIPSISLVRASNDVSRDVIRDVSDASLTSVTSVSYQLKTQSNVSSLISFRFYTFKLFIMLRTHWLFYVARYG